jgi:quinol monooxygenase YgiN
MRERGWASQSKGVTMIVVIGRVQSNAEKRDALVRIGEAVAEASREEAGCISYRLYEDTELENEFVFVEEWESREALRNHFGNPAYPRVHAGDPRDDRCNAGR